MKYICVICCFPMKDKLPYTDSSVNKGMCPSCEKIQDVFLERRIQEAKDNKENRRKGDKRNV